MKDYPGQPSLGSTADENLLRRAIATLSIDQLWDHFGFSARNGNPVCSPFREVHFPNFFVFDRGRKFIDYGTGDRGDSFGFYQHAKGQNAKEAFVGFVELAGLGSDLAKNGNGSAPQSAGGQIDIVEHVRKLSIYYDPERGCYWTKNDRDNWIKVGMVDVERHLKVLKFHSGTPKGQTVFQTDLIIDAIQRSMDVEYVGSLAGYQKGVFEFGGRRLLIVDSPVLVTPQKGDWSILAKFLQNLLGFDQIIYLYGWLKVALEALYKGKFRPGQALVLAGPKDCGKSLLQNLLTIVFGGRSTKPHQYMIGSTSFNGDLFSAEHLMIEDEEPATDIRSRRNFGTKVKEITANVIQRCHFKYRTALPLEPFWRLTISLNDETENLMILPPWDDSIEDKMILLKATSHDMPMPTVTNEEREAFWAKLVSELPAFVDFLFNWPIPQDLLSHRYGITHYQHPELLDALRSLEPENHLLELIDAEVFKCGARLGRPTDPWEGKASILQQRLIAENSSVRYAARKLLTFHAACGTYLRRLERLDPARISSKRSHRGAQIWIIRPPI